MILVDTSVWVDHIRAPDAELIHALRQASVLCHPFVIGELALGNLPDRAIWLRDLERLPAAIVARHEEVMAMIATSLVGRGIGYVDAHLLASARLSASRLWTRDRRLGSVATDLGIAHN